MRDYVALHRLLAERQSRPFEWGSDKHDCVSFWAACVKAQTGSNPLSWAPVLKWDSQESAEKVLEGLGGLEAAVGARMRVIDPRQALRGDGGLVRGMATVMMIEGDTIVGAGPKGLMRMRRSALVTAWSAT